jgi:Ca-activated chloride channel family protein
MRFLWPELLWLLLLLLPLAVLAYLELLRRRKRTAIRYASLRLVREALGPGRGWRKHVPPLLLLLAVAAAILALARPSATVVLPSDHVTLVLAIDVSLSMRATDVQPNRLAAAQAAAKQFIADLPKHVRVGVVSFAGTANVVQAPTGERERLAEAIDRFELQRATATGSAILVSLATLRPEVGIDIEQELFASDWSHMDPGMAATPIDRARTAKKMPQPVPPGSYDAGAIIMLSDGRRTTGPDPVEVAKLAADLGVRVHTVGFGTREGGEVSGMGGWSFYARLDEEALKAVAKITAAEYFQAASAGELHKVYRDLNTKLGLERKEEEVSALFSGAAAAFALLAALLSLLWFYRRA